MLDTSCFNISRCTQGFTFYVEPLSHNASAEVNLTKGNAPSAIRHRCQRIWLSNSSIDNLWIWAAECLVFIIKEYFQVRYMYTHVCTQV